MNVEAPPPVTLREITADSVIAVGRLSVAESQKGFVAPNAVSLAQALFAPEAWYRAIHCGDELAGFVMLSDSTLAASPAGRPEIGVWRFMIDARFQGRGVGRAALRLVVDHVRGKALFDELTLSYVPGPGCPEPFYRSLGFEPTGRMDDDEVVLALPLGGAPPAAAPAVRDSILLDLPAELETERLLMRPPRAGDGPRLHAAVAESLPELRRFLASLAWVAAEPSVEASEVFCRSAQADVASRKELPFLVFEKASGELVGAAGLHRIVWATPKMEVGYWCRTSRLRRGFVTESVSALTDFALTGLGAVRVELVTDEANEASRRVAERCGFRLDATLRNERRAPDGTLRTTCLYARLPPAP